jgi:Mg2+-importing ATPase
MAATAGRSWAKRGWQGLGWLFGLALLGAVILVVRNRSEERAFGNLLQRARPAWLLLGLALQGLTYAAEARVWQKVLARGGRPCRLRELMGLVLAKLFIDQAIPTGGISGTFVEVRGVERRQVARPVAMAAVVIELTSYYAAYVLALGLGVGVAAAHRSLPAWVWGPCLFFAAYSVGFIALLQALSRPQRWPGLARLGRLPLVRPLVEAVGQARPDLAHDRSLLAGGLGLHASILVCDAGTVWVMLLAVGQFARPELVFASFAFASLTRVLGVVGGGLGTFEAASVATLALIGVPAAAALAATLLFRGLSFYLPLVPGLVLAHRETRTTPGGAVAQGHPKMA